VPGRAVGVVAVAQGHGQQPVELDLAQDAVQVVALGRLGLGLEAAVAVHGQPGQGPHGRLVAMAEGLQQRRQQLVPGAEDIPHPFIARCGSVPHRGT
jgi:hypothetical protein